MILFWRRFTKFVPTLESLALTSYQRNEILSKIQSTLSESLGNDTLCEPLQVKLVMIDARIDEMNLKIDEILLALPPDK